MHRLIQFAAILALACTSALPAMADGPAAAVGAMQIVDPWARASAGNTANGAAFLEIRNTGSEADWLVDAASPAAMMTNIHETVMEEGVMKMRPVHGVEIPAGGTVILKPHGLHVMLMKLKTPLAEGKTVRLTLTFDKAGSVEIDVPIAAAGAMMAPHGN